MIPVLPASGTQKYLHIWPISKSPWHHLRVGSLSESASHHLRAIVMIVKAKAEANLCYGGLYKSVQSKTFKVAELNLTACTLFSGKPQRGEKHSPKA